jgi:hypothetical protein
MDDKPAHSYELFVPDGSVPIRRYDRMDVPEDVAIAEVFRDGDGVRHIRIPREISDILFEVILQSDGWTSEERRGRSS